MSDDRWSVYRVGTAAAATTVPGQTPAYGLAYDLATGTWQNADQFNQFARDVVPLSQAALIAQAQAAQQKTLHDLALERAKNYEAEGIATEDDASMWEQGVQSVKQQFSWLGSPIDSLKRDLKEIGGGGEDPEDLYSDYAKAGGLLTEDEFNSFGYDTQQYLTKSADSGENFKDLVETIPDPVMTVLMGSYRGLATPFNMIANESANNPGGLPLNLSNVLGSQWFKKDKWSQAWQESEEKSLGNAIVNTVLSPYASEDTLDDWQKNNSLYQFTSFGTEFAASWYADPVVIGSKGVGAAARISKNELPLNETGGVHRAMTQRLQRENVTETNPFVKGVADWRAQRMLTSKENVNEYLKTVPYGEAAALPMAKKRALQGAPIMYALHWANNRAPGALDEFAKSSKVGDALKAIELEKDVKLGSQGVDLVDLTWQMGFGDPKAYAVVNKLKSLVPDELEKVAGPGARTFIDAIEATKTKALSLDTEIESLTKAAEGARPGTFHRWEIDTELTLKQNQLNEVTDALKGYEGYGTWLELMGTKAGDKALPLIAQVNSPRPKRWNAVEKRRNNGVSRFFMDNQFGKAHTVREVPRALYLMKANTASMHDLDSGIMSLNRQAEQFEHFFGYADSDALEGALRSWTEAPTNLERYKTIHQFEETHLIRAASQHFGVSEDLIRAIFNKVNDERNRTIRGVLSGDGSVYSAAPSLASRVANADDHSVSLLSRSEDGKTVQLQLMDGRDHKITVTLPDSGLVERVLPVDVTQTPNYYTPIDTRQFYYELKRHKDMLQELDKGWFVNTQAGTMESIDTIGSVFNNLWKPAQLWRLGWPQRVLMDEGMRAMAWFGPAYWLYGPGADAASKAVSNIPYHIRNGMEKRRNGKVPLGAGPITRREKRAADPFVRAEEVAKAVHVPEVLWPKLNSGRQAVIAKTVDNWSAWKRYSEARLANGAAVDTVRPAHPMAVIRATRSNKELRVFDATNGRRVSNGFVVPIPDETMRFNLRRGDVSEATHEHNMMLWYERNAELLSREGMRVVTTPDGQLTIGRVFNSKQRKQASQFLQYVDETHPGTQMWDLRNGTSHHYEGPDETEFDRMLAEAKVEDAAREKARAASGDLRAQETAFENQIVSAFNDFDFQVDSVVDRVTRKIAQRREYGGGYMSLVSSDGQRFSVENAFEGHRGQLFRGLVSSNKSIDVLSEGHGGAMSLARRQAQGHKTYHPPVFTDDVLKKGTAANKQAVMYFQRWADMVNDQIGNSPIWGRMLHGQSDAQIVRWLEETPEGATVRREVMREHGEPAVWVNEHRAKLNYYLPSDKLQRLLAKGRLEPSDLRKNVHDDDLPDIFGPDIEVLDKRRGMGKFLNDVADKMWTGLGTIPIDALSRHPFAKAVYDMKMRSLIASTDSKWLDADTIARFQEQARQYSMLQVKRTLWDLTDQTNFTDALRFIAPFWGAQQEAITKWLRIISDRPETAARFFNTQRAAYQNFVVIDEDGQPVKDGSRKGGLHNLGLYHPTDRIVVNIPPFMRHGPLGKALETIGAVGVPIGSANTVLQGEMPLMPSPGPMLTMPVDKFLRLTSDTYGTTNDEAFVYRWLFPIGRPSGGFKGVMEQLSPGWGKRVMSASSGEDDVAKANVFMQVAREMYLEAERKGKPMPSNEDVAKQARWVWGLRVVAGLTMPVQTEFRPKNQFFVDAAHKYQREFGQEWFDKFLEEYGPEMASYATSSSNSLVDVPPTTEGMEEWSGNKRLIQKYPQWGGAIISPDAYTDDFSYDSYKAQFDISLGPGDNRKLRNLSSPTERFARADERVGWAEFRQFQSAIDAELYARGLRSIQQTGAEDLQELKRRFVADLTARHSAWRESYDNFSNDIYSRVNELQQFAFNKEFDNRPDMLGVRQYLLIRDQVATELDRYSATTGGSRSLQAEENGALREWFYAQVGSLIQTNPAFGELYNRYLDGDTLEQGSGGF